MSITRKHLNFYSNFYGVDPPSGGKESPLAGKAEGLVAEWEAKEAKRMEEAEARSATRGRGHIIATAKRIASGLQGEALSEVNQAVPCILAFDAYSFVKDASRKQPSDRGLSAASHILFDKWNSDVEGSLTLKDLDLVKAKVTSLYPKSAAGKAVDLAVTKVGFTTLKNLPGLARIASEITDQDSYEAAIEANSLTGTDIGQLRARGFIRALAGMEEEQLDFSTPPSATEAALDRVAQMMDGGDLEAPKAPGLMSPPDEAGNAASIPSPVSGEQISISLEKEESPMGSSGPEMPDSPGMAMPPGLGSAASDMEGGGATGGAMGIMGQLDLQYVGLLSELARVAQAIGPEMPTEAPGPAAPEAEPAGLLGEGADQTEETKTVIEDPTSGQDLELTLRPIEDEPPMEAPGAGAGPEGLPPVKAEAPPGEKYERMVKDIKKGDTYSPEKQKEVAYATAWKAKGKEKRKKKSYATYAVVDGESAQEPIDTATGHNIFEVFTRLAAFGVEGQVLMDARETDTAVVVLNQDRGDHLIITAKERKKSLDRDPFETEINEQQPDQMATPGDGGKALKSDGGYAQLRARADLNPDQQRQAASELGLSHSEIEKALFNGDAYRREGWEIRLAGFDSVEYGPETGKKVTASLLEVDDAIRSFQAAVVNEAYLKSAAFPLSFEEVFAYRCASCKEVSEYTMPKEATPLTCGHCTASTSVADVAEAFARVGSKKVSDYLISLPWPQGQDKRDAALNAKRILAEVKKVRVAELLEPEGAELRLLVRKADKPALARIEKALKGIFGVPHLTMTAQVGDTGATGPTPAITPQAEPMAMQPDASPYQGKTPTPDAPAGAPMSGMNQPMQTMQVGGQAQAELAKNNLDPLQKGKLPGMPGVAAKVALAKCGNCGHSATMHKEGGCQEKMSGKDERCACKGMAKSSATKTGQMAGPEMAGPPPGGPPMPMPQGPEAPQLMGQQPSQALEGIPSDPQMPPDAMGGMDEVGKEAALAALMHYRNQGMGILEALAEFKRQYSDYVDSLGDETSPRRQAAEAEVVKSAIKVYEKPALVQPSEGGEEGGPKMASMSGSDLDAEDEEALALFKASLHQEANSRNEKPGKGLEPHKVNTQQPDWVKPEKGLGPDGDTREPGFGPGEIPTQHPPRFVKLTPNPSDLGPDSDGKEADLSSPPMPAAGGQGGSQAKQKGESWSNTDLGKDSATGEVPSTRSMSDISNKANDALRSK